MVMRKSLLFAALATVAMFALVGTAFGATTYSGGASVNNEELTLTSATSDSDTGNDFGLAQFDVPAGTTFADLTTLSTDFNVTDDGCMSGSPRFQIKVDTGSEVKNIFAYLGPEPNYADCPLNTVVSSGDLLESGRAIDTSQVGGTFYDTYENAVANYGSYSVVNVQLVVDSGWAFSDGEQTVVFDNVMINDTTYDFAPVVPTDKEQCKKGGWQNFTDPVFKNQGQCVSYVQSNR